MAFSRRSRRSSSRKTRRVRRRTSRSTGLTRRVPRSLGGLGKMRDVHHFKQIVDGGTITTGNFNGNVSQTTGACVMRLGDLPIYIQMAPNFEFARLNKCRIEFIPKYNMQLNQLTTGTAALATGSITGTFITAIDQIPIYTAASAGSTFTKANTWVDDGDENGSASYASFVQTSMTPNYVRGLQGAKETELYKKQVRSFYPAFYDTILTQAGNSFPGPSGIQSIGDPLPTGTATAVVTNGCVERRIKKWVSINNVTSGSTTALGPNGGPLYFGPVYALDVNVPGSTALVPMFDVRFHYSVSFKRYKGSL